MDHPRGVQPFGNSLLSGIASIRDTGLGCLHVLSDALLLDITGQLAAKDLVNLCLTSKSLYCFATYEDVWKALVLQEFEGKFTWAGWWKQAYAATHAARRSQQAIENQDTTSTAGHGLTNAAGKPKQRQPKKQRQQGKQKQAVGKAGQQCEPLKVQGFYSDLLYQPWFCATIELPPEWLEVDNIDRRSGLSVEDFIELYERPNRPVVITDKASEWPAMRKWTTEYLSKAFAGQDIIAGNYEMPFETYMQYCRDNRDEMPLYLFDKGFSKRAPGLAADYSVPPYFTDDLFSVLGEDQRPDYRWLIMGPSRSGSSFHQDPNSTSAWNAVVSGSKKWVMYPPHITPPGVHPSPDGADVATPMSLVEWFLNFYQEAKEGKVKPVECVVKAGEMIFVPRGWWHMAINLEDGIAITQNYVSQTTLPHVLAFLRPGRSEHLVSGCSKDERSSLYERFTKALQERRPDIMEMLEVNREAKRRKVEEQNKLSALFKAPAASMEQSRAETVEKPRTEGFSAVISAPGSSSFSFGFKL